jgi:hypothetical protein
MFLLIRTCICCRWSGRLDAAQPLTEGGTHPEGGRVGRAGVVQSEVGWARGTLAEAIRGKCSNDLRESLESARAHNGRRFLPPEQSRLFRQAGGGGGGGEGGGGGVRLPPIG